MNTDIQPSTIDNAVNLLRQGEAIVIPTETVYGLVADANNPAAIEKVFMLKRRDKKQALAIFIKDYLALAAYARNIPQIAWQLAKQFWPGPLTLILEKQAGINSYATSGKNTVGIRIPNQPIAHQILEQFDGPLVATSANISGEPAACSASTVQLTNNVPLIIDGGTCDLSQASTIIDLSQPIYQIVRTGSISQYQLIQAGLTLQN